MKYFNNMKRVIFKGVVNNEVFDNVQDYNKKMNELLGAGSHEIQASSSTQVYDEAEPVEVKDEQVSKSDPGTGLPEEAPGDDGKT